MFLCISYKTINENINNKKKNFGSNIFGAITTLFSGNDDLTKCCVYRIVNEILLDKNDNPLINKYTLNEFIVK